MEDNLEGWILDNLTFIPYEHEKHGHNIRVGSILIAIINGEKRTILVGDINQVFGECDCCAYIRKSDIISIASMKELSRGTDKKD